MAFRSEGDARAWERGRGGDAGAIVSVEVLGELSREWYAGRLDDAWRPYSARARQALLRDAGLDGEFWELG
ncbi:MAG: hypothetical protein OXH49_07615 [Gemmatimonadetes bacterium]|nr:hypothetical protein [Gemmatimonadota bacterium]